MLEEKAIPSQTVLSCQAALDEQLQIPIDRRTGDLVAVRTHPLEQLLGVEVTMLGEQFVQQSKTLRRHPHSLGTQGVDEDLSLSTERHKLIETASQ